MKTLRTILFALLLIFAVAISSSKAQNVRLGLFVGPNISNVTTSPSLTTNSRTGLDVGGTAEFHVNGPFYIQPAFEFIQKGWDETGASVKLGYVQIPVYFKFKFDLSTTDFKPYFLAGPSLGFNASADADYTSGGTTITTDIKNNIESVDFGFEVGTGGEFKVGNTVSLYGTFTYSLGLTDIWKNTNYNIKNTGIKLNFGLLFDI